MTQIKRIRNQITGEFNLSSRSDLYCRNPGSTTLKQRVSERVEKERG